VVLIPRFPLIQWAIESQALNGVLLPVVVVLMLLLINRKDLMGEHTNSHWLNAIAWVTAIVVSALSVIWMVQQFRPAHH
jgi:Mn2+/Fe2+ NRAMP family transporter